MLRWRLLGAIAILTPLLVILWLDDQYNAGHPGIWVGPLATVVGLCAAHEVTQMMSRAGLPTSPTASSCGVLSVMLAAMYPLTGGHDALAPLGMLAYILLGLVVAVALLFATEMNRFRVPGESIARLSAGVFVVVYVGVLLSFLVELRLMLPGRIGLMAIIATLVIVKLSDTGAFFVGRSWGRHHFTSISPKKTIEGVMGGVISAMLAAWLLRDGVIPYLLPTFQPGSHLAYLAFGASLAIGGLFGDLSESLLKRDVQQKDSSQWLRGLGGALDVVDSVLATAPISFLWWATGWL